jgi:Sulfatase
VGRVEHNNLTTGQGMRLWATAVLALAATGPQAWASEAAPKPNIIIVFNDDMGYGDLGAYGPPTIQTPSTDRIEAEGQKWTQLYSAASVCTPSRAGLLTGPIADPPISTFAFAHIAVWNIQKAGQVALG